MPLSIKDPDADRLARALARRTGETLTEAVTKALRERLQREQRKEQTVENLVEDAPDEWARTCELLSGDVSARHGSRRIQRLTAHQIAALATPNSNDLSIL